MSAPKMIVLEGLDGCGKSTLGAALAEHLGAASLQTPLAELGPQRDALDHIFGARGLARGLFYAAQVAVASGRAAQLLGEGRSVVVDRFWLSTVAYAQAQGVSLPLDWLERILRPSVTLFLTLPQPLRRARLMKRSGSLKEHDRAFMDPEGDEAALGAYRSLFGHPCAGPVIEVDVSGMTVEANLRRILRVLNQGGG